MDPPAADLPAAVSPHQRRRPRGQRGGRTSRQIEWAMFSMILFSVLALLKFGPTVRNYSLPLPTHDIKDNLPSQAEVEEEQGSSLQTAQTTTVVSPKLSSLPSINKGGEGGGGGNAKFCGETEWKAGVSCNKRVSFLVNKYSISEQQSRIGLLEQGKCQCGCPRWILNVQNATVPTPTLFRDDGNSSTKKKKTLVIVIGNLRGTEQAWNTLISNVLDPNDADLALMIGDLPKEMRTSSLFRRAKYTWFFNEYDDWGRDVIDTQIMNSTAWRQILPAKDSPSGKSGLWGGIPGYKGSGLIIFAMRWFVAKKIKELGLQVAYDIFVITRSDHYYGCQHKISQFFDPSALWLPSGEDYLGYTDRHLVVGKDFVLKALDILPPFLSRPRQEWVYRGPANPEQILKSIWEDVHGLSIKRFQRVMFTVAGRNDTTRWRTKGAEIPCLNGLHSKYINEFYKANQICTERLQTQEAVVWKREEEQKNTSTSVSYAASLCKFKDTNMGLCHFIPYGNNFGDEIGPLVSKKLVEDHFNCNGDSLPVWNLAKRGGRKGTCLFSLGSIFHMVKDGDHVWGTGVNPYWQRQVPGNLNIHAVRGPYTEDFLMARGVIKESVGHGDPGLLLLPHMIPASIDREQRKHQFCFVAHAQDKGIVNELAVQRDHLSQNPDIHVIHAQAHLQQVVKSLLMCSHVASTSLHGLILADAFGIPSRWFQFSESKTEKTEGHFKYQDYYSSIGRDNATHAENFEDVFNTSTYWEILAEERRHNVVQTLKTTFPYHLFYSDSNS